MQYFNRERSWLSFNERVLQEAMDSRNPIIERMRFLGIYSNNLDEFFRVRVANLRRMIAVKDKSIQGFQGSPKELFNEIRVIVVRQQRAFRLAYQRILRELAQHKIFHINEKDLSDDQKQELIAYFENTVKQAIVPIILTSKTPFPRLRDSSVYLAIKMTSKHESKKPKYALIRIPSNFNRFYLLKDKEGQKVILLDDIIRLNLDSIFSIFSFEKAEAFTFKFSRDAELDLDDDIAFSLKEKVEKSLKLRKKGVPVRFVYDEEMPHDLLAFLLEKLNLEYGVNTIAGGRYHNFKDFMSFPDFGRKDFVFNALPPLPHRDLMNKRSILLAVQKKDVFLHYPYHQFSYLVDLLRESAIDPKVKSIKINIYRVSKDSQVLNALVNAVMNGKQVVVYLEPLARFDEENNLFWLERLKEYGATVIYGFPGLKVHSKLIQITRGSGENLKYISHVGTGNFHERTSKIYGDLSFITSDFEIGKEVAKVFEMLEQQVLNRRFRQLLVSPINNRSRLIAYIKEEIAIAKSGKDAWIKIKLNNLTDKEMIDWLYKANNAGVKIEMIIRGICCIVPGIEGQSENIKVISIVDRFLEHARVIIFGNNGNARHFITSADWMERNLDNRIEVGVPIMDSHLKTELDEFFEIQWKGNVKTRIIGKAQVNKYRRSKDSEVHQAQLRLYDYYESRISNLVDKR